MARTAISVTEAQKGDGINPASFDNGDSTNDMKVPDNNGDIVLIIDNDTGAAATVTVVSVEDFAGRLEDIVLSMAAGDIAFTPPLKASNWNQSDGSIHVNLDANVNIAAIRLP